MDKKLWENIKKVAEFYNININDSEKENSGVFIKLDNNKVKMNDLSESEIFDKVFCLNSYKLNYSSFIICNESTNKNVLNINKINKCSNFYDGNGKVA